MGDEDESLAAVFDAVEDKSYCDICKNLQREANLRDRLDPTLWYKYRWVDLRTIFSCKRVFTAGRLVYSHERWADLRNFWHKF